MSSSISKPTIVRTDERGANLLKAADEFRQVEAGHSAQGLLWIVFKAALCSEYADDWRHRDLDNIMFLYERLHNIISDIDPDRSDPKYRSMSDLDLG